MAIESNLVGALGGAQVARIPFVTQSVAGNWANSRVTLGPASINTIGAEVYSTYLMLPIGDYAIGWEVGFNDSVGIPTAGLQTWIETAGTGNAPRTGLVTSDPSFSDSTFSFKHKRVSSAQWAFNVSSTSTRIYFYVCNGTNVARTVIGYGATIIKLS